VAKLRLFVALWPTTATRGALAAVQGAVRWPAGARLASANGLHLTLAFIGMLPQEQLAEATRACRVASARLQLVLDRLEVWNDSTAVLCPSETPHALLELQSRLAASLCAAGVPFDARAFAPHVTLARKARGLAPAALPPLRWRSTGHVLALSAGGRYRVIARFA
jgi:2'-5' RNA ligase